jgi:hypothetical protein
MCARAAECHHLIALLKSGEYIGARSEDRARDFNHARWQARWMLAPLAAASKGKAEGKWRR